MQPVKLTQKFINTLINSTSHKTVYDNAVSGLHILIDNNGSAKWVLTCGKFTTEIGYIKDISLVCAREQALLLLSELQHQSLKALTLSIQNINFIPNIDVNIHKQYISTIAELLEKYKAAGGSSYITQTVEWHFDKNMPICEINILWIEKWRENYIKQGHKIASGNRIVAALRALLNWANERELCNCKISKLKMLPETDSITITRILSPEEDSRIRLALQKFNPVFRAIIIVELNTGIRMTALLSLQWEDIDFNNHTIRLRAATAKSKKTKYVPMNSEAANCLYNLEHLSEFVFTNKRTGKRYVNITKQWKALLETAQIKNLRFHDLRHNVASQLVMNGVSLYEVSQILTHSDTKVTERYAHLLPDKKLQAMEQLAKGENKL